MYLILSSGIVKVNEPSCTSLFCQNSNEGSVGQLLWRDNNKQAVVIAPKVRIEEQTPFAGVFSLFAVLFYFLIIFFLLKFSSWI